MERKIKRLNAILIIGTIILFLAGLSFLFVKTVDNYIKTTTMVLIAGVLGYLSYYEENNLKLKGTSILTHIFSCISIAFSYITISAYKYFGSWFALTGDGYELFLATIFILVGLLLVVSAVRYKVYKLIELSIWFGIVAAAFIIMQFEVNPRYVLIGLLLFTLGKNIFKFTNYSRWVTLVLCLFSIFSIFDTTDLLAIAISVLIVANTLYLVFFNDKVQVFPLIIVGLNLIGLTIVFKHAIIFFVIASIIEIAINYFKRVKGLESGIFVKIVFNILYLVLMTSAYTDTIKYSIPAIYLLTSLINIFVNKDYMEEYLLPFKSLYFIVFELNNLSYEFIKEYIIVFISNIVILLMYFMAKKKSIKYTNLVLLGLINLFTILRVSTAVFPNIVYLVLFALDFYMIYINEEKGSTPLSIIFVVYSFFLIANKMDYLDATFALAIAIVYALYMAITRKNKLVFGTSLFVFNIATMTYLNNYITDPFIMSIIENVLYIEFVTIFTREILVKKNSKAIFVGVTIGLQIIYNLFGEINVLFKIIALIQAIALIVLSIKDEDYKGLYIEGIIGVVISLFNIITTIASLPKSLYLILVGLTIVCIVPVFINKYLKLQAEEKKKQEEKKKKNARKKSVKTTINFCPECGTKVTSEGNFCAGCGAKIK